MQKQPENTWSELSLVNEFQCQSFTLFHVNMEEDLIYGLITLIACETLLALQILSGVFLIFLSCSSVKYISNIMK